MDLGFSRAGFIPIWANDIDASAVKTYNSIFGDKIAVTGDIRKQVIPRSGAADLVIGGPPCQGFSVAGKMDPDDPRSRHVWDFLGVVKRVRPIAFVMENVKSLAENKRWCHIRSELLSTARGFGYRTKLFVLNAAHFEVPQARERMFLVGLLGCTPAQPKPVTLRPRPSVRSVLDSLPRFGTPGNNTLCTAKITPARRPVLRRSPYAGMLFNGQGRPLRLDGPALTLPATMGGNRTPIVDQEELEMGTEGWVVAYHRRLARGECPVDQVPDRLRRITVEEAAALQTFPPGIHWSGPQSAKYRQIGNAVPPKLAYHVALSIRDAITGSFPEPFESFAPLEGQQLSFAFAGNAGTGVPKTL